MKQVQKFYGDCNKFERILIKGAISCFIISGVFVIFSIPFFPYDIWMLGLIIIPLIFFRRVLNRMLKKNQNIPVTILWILVLLYIVAAPVAVIGINVWFRNSEIIYVIDRELEINPTLIEKYGKVEGYGLVSSYSRQYINDEEQVQISLTVKGQKRYSHDRFFIYKPDSESDWEVSFE